MYTSLFYLIVFLITLDFVFERILNYLNKSSWTNVLPAEFKGIYDPSEYKRSQDYFLANQKFGNITSSYSFVLILLMVFLGGFALVDAWAGQISENPIVRAVLFFGFLGLAMDILSTPFSLYDTFVIEEKFGFNKSTIGLFFMDKVKGWLLGAIIGGGILALVVWFYGVSGKYFWLYTWGFITVFMVFMNMFYSSLIVPLFNKQTPLEEGELRDGIESLSEKVGFKLDNIFVIDGSKRSSKANAYFSGLGPKKRIVLFDTLIKDLSQNEIIAVLAHEIGHYKKKHTKKGMFLSVLQTGLTLFILSWFIRNPALSAALGVGEASFHVSLIAFGILYSPISTILGLGMNVLSRKNEFEADAYARKYFSAEHLSSALKTLTVKNLGNLQPHPLYVFFNYSHPPVLKRIEALQDS
ncbi:MAG: M48 family metallopeptidase [Bacteroidota bacterium]|nr:M48 family metallopeptidase [Bacteroidota bacterium]